MRSTSGPRLSPREILADGTPEDRRRALLRRHQVRWVLDTAGTRRWTDAYVLETIAGPGPSRLIRVA